MTNKPMPDSPDANRLGCACPTSPNGRGEGVLLDGVRSWTISERCPIHTKPGWWLPKRKEGIG